MCDVNHNPSIRCLYFLEKLNSYLTFSPKVIFYSFPFRAQMFYFFFSICWPLHHFSLYIQYLLFYLYFRFFSLLSMWLIYILSVNDTMTIASNMPHKYRQPSKIASDKEVSNELSPLQSNQFPEKWNLFTKNAMRDFFPFFTLKRLTDLTYASVWLMTFWTGPQKSWRRTTSLESVYHKKKGGPLSDVRCQAMEYFYNLRELTIKQ